MPHSAFPHKQKYPSEEQGGYDPIPTHPEPLSPGRTTVNPEELPDNEDVKPLEQEDVTDIDPERVRKETDGEKDPR